MCVGGVWGVWGVCVGVCMCVLRTLSAKYLYCLCRVPAKLKTNRPPLLCFELHCFGGLINYCSKFPHISVPTAFTTRSSGVTTYITPYSLTALSFINSHLSVHRSRVRQCGTTRLYGFLVMMCCYTKSEFISFVRKIDTLGINFSTIYNEFYSTIQLKQVRFSSHLSCISAGGGGIA